MNKNDIQMLIDKLVNAVSYKFKEDGTSPGLTVSKLKTGYYCSVVRHNVEGKTKVVVCKYTGDTLESAVMGVVGQFLTVVNSQKDPLQELENFVKV